ncbi:hypothetical protein I3843_16G115400 [Carya illinoinensis]|nr:hypothetical protein I3760_16G118800 [Carya illinoinensis]KAG2665195.1 hypothetical protein I3760_16G118800 [Carya illinoinensis]KAG7942661.1 hypothetical protein I3843_16G115400 [Carya illinoinensis]KAG7942662.1 hypothetical protein I3843_16G115400 [Carya illinoinensis]KAG7942663.1 hypothetical protein I3843_16G115400 [Carya illinoinensis]
MADNVEPMSSTTSMEKEKRDLLKNAMKGQWRKVVETYKNKTSIHKEKITRSGETALHIAVSDGQTKIVRQLIIAIKSQTDQNAQKLAVSVKNKQGNTALHFAASKEKEHPIMCMSIADVDPSLVGCPNREGETPFFLAAFHGKKRAFLCLHRICAKNNQDGYDYSTRNDGNTILHCAINGQHFDLAFQIIQLYPNLANKVNEKGLSPLHILAAKPSAFRSGKPHGSIWHRAIYNRIFVDELKLDMMDEDDIIPNNLPKRRSLKNTCGCVAYARGTNDELDDHTEQTGQDKEINISDEYSGRHHDHGASTRGTNDELDDHTEQTGQDIEINISDEYSGRHHDHGGIHAANESDQTTGRGFETNIPDGYSGRHHDHGGIFSPFFKLASSKAMWIISWFLYIFTSEFKGMLLLPFGIKGYGRRRRMEHMIRSSYHVKQKHTWAIQIMNKLLDQTELYQGSETWAAEAEQEEPDQYRDSTLTTKQESNPSSCREEDRETPILTAAKYGVIEMVERILELYPIAIYDETSVTKKNIMLLAVEKRQIHVYQLLLQKTIPRDSVFGHVDRDGNSALHLASKLAPHTLGMIPGLQMLWEMRWYQYVRDSMPPHFFPLQNKQNETPIDMFTQSHQRLVKSGGKWLSSTSNSSSVVATLIASVTFATAATIPGGFNQNNGTPMYENQPVFYIFAISSLFALFFSVTSVVMFYALMSSPYEARDFSNDLPVKLLMSLMTLFLGIASMLISFCAAHFFLLKNEQKTGALVSYAVVVAMVIYLTIKNSSLFLNLLRITFSDVPERLYELDDF